MCICLLYGWVKMMTKKTIEVLQGRIGLINTKYQIIYRKTYQSQSICQLYYQKNCGKSVKWWEILQKIDLPKFAIIFIQYCGTEFISFTIELRTRLWQNMLSISNNDNSATTLTWLHRRQGHSVTDISLGRKAIRQQRITVFQLRKVLFLTFIAVLEVISLRIKPSVFTKQKPSQINFGLMKYWFS